MSSTLVTSKPRHTLVGDRITNIRGCRLAMIACCPLGGMKNKLSLTPLSKPFLYNVDLSSQHMATLGQSKILLVECEQCENLKNIIEEIAGLGIRTIIGYGLAETMTNQIPAGQIVLADSAATVEQNSCKFSYPHHGLFHDLRSVAARRCLSLRRAKTVSVNAGDPDCFRKINVGRAVGAEVLSEEATVFYSAGRLAGASTIYACIITASLQSPSLTVQQGMNDLQSLLLSLADDVVASMNEG